MSVPIREGTGPDGAGNATVRIGEQVTGFEEPDTIYMKLVGVVQEAEVQTMNQMHLDFSRGRSEVFFLVDMSELETIPNAARKSVIEALNQMPLSGLSIYQAPLTARVFAKLITTGMRIFGKHIPLEFCDTEAEARAWIEQRRSGGT